MRQWIRSHLTFANVVAAIALFVALGGTALAATVINSNGQVASGTISGHKPPSGKHANIIAGSINGQDIADRSGVDTCKAPATLKFGPICAGSDGAVRTFGGAVDYCAGLGLRLPTASEAVTLAKKYDVPGISGGQVFWSDESILDGNSLQAQVVGEDGGSAFTAVGTSEQAVCVTDPIA